jgi:spore germination protein YaaH
MASRRAKLGAALAASLAVATIVGVTTRPPGEAAAAVPGDRSADDAVGATGGSGGASAVPGAVPKPGHEVYGVAAIKLTTLALFSVSQGPTGAILTRQAGYRQIKGPIGRQLIEEARHRHVRVELVFSTFGYDRNQRFFSSADSQARTIRELVQLAGTLGVDGINVDAELVNFEQMPAYGTVVGQLRSALRARHPRAQVSVATAATDRGALMASLAAAAGADRIFMMGYDYHWPKSEPGASAPLARRDGDPRTLGSSLDLYRSAGVPVERTILGLPLFGVSWPVAGADIGASSTAQGSTFIPRKNLDVLGGGSGRATFDPLEGVEFLAQRSGSTWRAIYYDSPRSLQPKLQLADERGLAGAGFWALGYTRGLPQYTTLINRFRAGRIAISN